MHDKIIAIVLLLGLSGTAFADANNNNGNGCRNRCGDTVEAPSTTNNTKQTQTAKGGNATATGGKAIANGGRSNSRSNSAAIQGQLQGQGQHQGQNQGQSQLGVVSGAQNQSAVGAGNTTDVTISETVVNEARRPAASMPDVSVSSTAPCIVGVGGSGGVSGFGIGITAGVRDHTCSKLEVVRVGITLGDNEMREAAKALYLSIEYFDDVVDTRPVPLAQTGGSDSIDSGVWHGPLQRSPDR